MRFLVLCVMAWPFAAFADAPCSNDHFMHAFDPALTHQACKEFRPQQYSAAPPASYNALRLGTSAEPSRAEKAGIDALTAIVMKTAAAAAQVRMPMPNKMTFMLLTSPLPAEADRALHLRDADASPHEEHDEHPCLIGFHYTSTDPKLGFSVAHQIFHCMVLTAWPEARLAAGDSNWWAEGGAEFFASIAYPLGFTDVDAATFHANESAELFIRGADAVVFFDWYATQPGKLKGLIDTVNDKPIDAVRLELYEDVGSRWLEFEEAYFDHTIHAPGGLLVNYADSPAPPTSRITSSTTKTFDARPYAIRTAILEFAEGHAYELDHGPNDDFKYQWTEAAAGGWGSAPTVVHTCHQMRRYRIVMAGKQREVTKRLRITAREEHEADCPCLVGSWQQTAASLARVPQRLQQHGIRNASCSLTGGGTLLTFNADHTGADVYQALGTECSSPQVRSTGLTNGARSFTWADGDATHISITSAGGNASSHITISARGHSTEQDAPLTSTGAGTVTFRCTRSDLHLEYGSGDAFDYTRASSPR